ncbi:hypothetical protein [bacterium endosymbiont of Bathymodiolus sp. 5 South]|jgi:hypothetical protein|uniref:hypothetical protein n=1 Tax=bacterium endosymbiont of Bathymodiolus sp. 5 South TaxID=1181670 RepID=UPI0010BACBB0|nr:hypothetical protein [bacterium endosymbiont of Bathymodiolus sp. 5 South]SSC06927.1 FIG00769654: hypothetical protein [bacterium endosymbiont of Bathymodiolus sp. 5 South]VVH61506.1 hypothetical protein BSPWISOX_1805 [uncultured Gammaproteobacteria bacterium]VVM20727.1 hypothetical protein BSPWISOXPB_935 [uncultured Gammaproteobacteria bacterium]
MGLHDDGKTGGALNSWGQYAKSGDIIFDVTGGLGGSIALRASSKVVGKVSSKLKVNKISESIANGHASTSVLKCSVFIVYLLVYLCQDWHLKTPN